MKVTTTVKPMTREVIIEMAKAKGYVPVPMIKNEKRYIKTVDCPECDGKLLCFSQKGKGIKYHTVRACTCGHRELFGNGFIKKAVTNEPAIPVEKARVTCKCGNVLPKGRGMYCHTCVAPTRKKVATPPKEAASPNVTM